MAKAICSQISKDINFALKKRKRRATTKAVAMEMRNIHFAMPKSLVQSPESLENFVVTSAISELMGTQNPVVSDGLLSYNHIPCAGS